MKTLQVRLPDLIHSRVKRFSREAEMSMNQFIVTSISNEIVREETSDFFRNAASQYDPKAFADALADVPDVAPEDDDLIDRDDSVGEVVSFDTEIETWRRHFQRMAKYDLIIRDIIS